MPDVITKEFYESFINSMNGLNVLKPDIEPRATKTIGEMIAMVKNWWMMVLHTLLMEMFILK